MSRSRDQSQSGPTPMPDRVVAAPWQVAALHQLLRRAGENPPKEEIVRTGKETGLEVRWIRNWLSRYRKGRTKTSNDGLNTTRKQASGTEWAPTSTASSTVSAAGHSSSSSSQSSVGGTISIHRLLQIYQDTGRREKRKRKPDTVVPGPDSAVEPTSASTIPYVQIAKPGSSFSLPLHSGPQTQSDGSSSSAESPQVDTGLKTRLLTQSPSLGYIPLAFPMQLSQPPGANGSAHSVSDNAPVQLTDSGSSSASVIPDWQYSPGGTEATQPIMYSQDFVPVVPTLPLDVTQPGSSNGQASSNMIYLSQLLLDASNVHVPPPATGASGDSEYLSELSPLSFAPSLQSHSTSVLGTVSMGQNVWYPPPPVAFRARVTDLALLTKRIRTTYEQGIDVPGVQGSSIAGAEGPSTGACTSTTFETSRASPILGHGASDLGDDSDADEELLTPTGDIPSFVDGLTQIESSTKTGGKGKQVVYDVYRSEDGILTGVI